MLVPYVHLQNVDISELAIIYGHYERLLLLCTARFFSKVDDVISNCSQMKMLTIIFMGELMFTPVYF